MSESNSEKTTPQDISSTGDQSDSQNDPTPSSAEAPANDERKATSTTEAANEKPFDPEDEFRAMFAPGPDGKPNRNQPDLQSLLAQLMGAGFGGAGASGAVTTSSQDDVTNLVTPGAMVCIIVSSSCSRSIALSTRSRSESDQSPFFSIAFFPDIRGPDLAQAAHQLLKTPLVLVPKRRLLL